jgi:predicted NAD/FAD-dependent oxidoreductase
VSDVIVVGAGLAGLVAAHRLSAAGAQVHLLEKGAGPGGRLATRRIDGARLDHGAQFFTVRSTEFSRLVDAWRSEGCPVDVWGHGLARADHITHGPAAACTGGDSHPRYVVRGGMNVLATHLARGLDVRPSAPVSSLAPRSGRWRVTLATGEVAAADHAVLTPPVPQSLSLLDAEGRWLPASARRRLEAVTYDPCLALLARLDRDPGLPHPGGVQIADGPVRFLGDNRAKGVSAEPSLTVHLAGDVSRTRYDEEDEAVAADVLPWIRPWLDGADVVAWQLKRWRYSQPIDLDGQRCLSLAVDGARLTVAGDGFAEAKVEGAARSGLAAATAILTDCGGR